MGCDAAGVKWLVRLGHALLPWLIMVTMACLSYTSLRVAMADLIYPQQQVLRRSHWVYRVDPAKKKRRIQRALRWTPSNGWYWHNLAELEAKGAWQKIRSQGLTQEVRQQAAPVLRQAIAAYRRTLQQNPSEPYTQLSRLSVLSALSLLEVLPAEGKNGDLSTLSTHIATLAPADPYLQYALGYLTLVRTTAMVKQVSAGQRKAEKSLPFFQQALRLDASYGEAVLHVYRTYLSEAEALYGFIRTIPHTPQGHFRAAKVLEDEFWQQARLQYLAALRLEHSSRHMMRTYAAALHRHHEFAAARKMWERLKASHRDDTTAYLGLADAYRGLGDHAARLQTLRELVSRFPQHAEYRQRLAEAYMHLGKNAEAEAEWTRLTSMQPQSVLGYRGLARLYESRRDYAAAIAMMQRVIAIAPGTSSHHHYLARLYESNGESAKALWEYKRLTILRPDDAAAFYLLGEYFRQEGEYLRALAYYRRAQALAPQQALYPLQMGLAHAARQEYRQAIVAYQDAIKLAATDPYSYYYLGLSYEALGAEELARGAYAMALQLKPDEARFRHAAATMERSLPF